MSKANTVIASMLLGLSFASAHAGQKLEVTIIDRQDNAKNYTYVVPGYSSATTNGSANCLSYGNSANCNGTAYTSVVSNLGYSGSYEVRGTTLSLQLPDGRIAVVNCEAKLNWTEWTNPNVYRSCRIPLIAKIQADFNGDKAKLSWSVSIDGKKMQTETYKILAVLDKPEADKPKDEKNDDETQSSSN